MADISADNTVMENKRRKHMEKFINNAPFALVLVFLVIGFVLLIKGADFFVEGSSSVAKRLHVPSIIIGLTIVAMGTSLPETAVSVSASLTGNNELAVSNVVGSNIFNLMVVIGVCAMIAAVNVAKEFNEKIGIDGIIVTKLDGDTRGGAALSIKAITGKPILYIGMGEKLSDLEQFHPDRMASRILGMGDVLSLIEKAEQSIDQDKAKEMEQRLKKAQFTFDDYLEYMGQIKNMGGLSSLLSMMPGVGGKINDDMLPDEKQLGKIEAIIYSMTKEERSNPDVINPSRKQRIAKGAGVDISQVNKLVKQFEQARKMMKSMPGLMGGKGKKKRGGFKMPFGF